MQRKIIGKNDRTGKVPAIILNNPKKGSNVAGVVRTASCYGIKQVWYSGNRVSLDPAKGERLPREERMKGYKDVDLYQHDYPFDCFQDAIPIAVEVRRTSEPLPTFEHPENAVYVFGPEDGSISPVFLRFCQRFVVIPTRHCLNLSNAVSVVMNDRFHKRHAAGLEPLIVPGEFEQRGLYLGNLNE